jgi:hypothetical protein
MSNIITQYFNAEWEATMVRNTRKMLCLLALGQKTSVLTKHELVIILKRKQMVQKFNNHYPVGTPLWLKPTKDSTAMILTKVSVEAQIVEGFSVFNVSALHGFVEIESSTFKAIEAPKKGQRMVEEDMETGSKDTFVFDGEKWQCIEKTIDGFAFTENGQSTSNPINQSTNQP